MFKNNGELDKIKVASVAVCSLVFVFAIVGFFVLPEKIYVQLFSGVPVPETSTVLFIIGSALTVALASLMCILSENTKKWLATETVLAILVIGCMVYNFIVLQ